MDGGAESVGIMTVATGDDDDVVVGREFELQESLGDGADALCRMRERLGGDHVGPVVEDGDVKAGGVCDGGEGGADVAGPGDDEMRRRLGVVVQVVGLVLFVAGGEGDGGGLAGEEGGVGGSPGVGVVSCFDELEGNEHGAAADQAVVPAVVVVEGEAVELGLR